MQLFDEVDANKDGLISLDDLRSTVASFGEDDAELAQAVLDEADLCGEGVITFCTFMRVLCGCESQVF